MTGGLLLDINKFTPYAVGFDRVFGQMTKYIENQSTSTGYPPYNISQEASVYTIEIALAGVDKNDINIEIADSTLTVTYTPSESKTATQHAMSAWLYKGIALRGFKRVFTIADDIKVVNAKMVNGMLSIYLEREIPEIKKPRKVLISE